MIRFILKQSFVDVVSELREGSFFTVDIEVPELESILLAGRYDQYGHKHNSLVGVEILPKEPKE